jgi:hypothetical protein
MTKNDQKLELPVPRDDLVESDHTCSAPTVVNAVMKVARTKAARSLCLLSEHEGAEVPKLKKAKMMRVENSDVSDDETGDAHIETGGEKLDVSAGTACVTHEEKNNEILVIVISDSDSDEELCRPRMAVCPRLHFADKNGISTDILRITPIEGA